MRLAYRRARAFGRRGHPRHSRSRALWGHARLSGDLFSATRQRDVLRALAAHVFRLIGGDRWAAAEPSSSNSDLDGLANLKLAISKRGEESGIGAALDRDCAALSAATCEERVQRVASLATSFHLLPSSPRIETRRDGNIIGRGEPADVRDSMWLSELALRLASNPAVVEEWPAKVRGPAKATCGTRACWRSRRWRERLGSWLSQRTGTSVRGRRRVKSTQAGGGA